MINKNRENSCLCENIELEKIHHEHNHSESSHETSPPISVMKHDGAIVGNVRCIFSVSLKNAMFHMKRKMQKIANLVEENNGFIGHIKGIIEETGDMYRLSMVDAVNVNCEQISSKKRIKTENVFIVFGIEQKDLESWLIQEFDTGKIVDDKWIQMEV